MKPVPGERNRVSDGTRVCLLVGGMDPPTMDVLRALDVIDASGRFEGIWLCPLPGGVDDESKRALTQVACAEWSSASGKQVGCCTMAMDKGLRRASELADECRRYFPRVSFDVVMFHDESEGEDPDQVICFRGQTPRGGARAIKLSNFNSEGDVRGAIASGSDVRRSFSPGVWEMIQKRRLYRRRR